MLCWDILLYFQSQLVNVLHQLVRTSRHIALLLKMSEILSRSQGKRLYASYMNSNECPGAHSHAARIKRTYMMDKC
jgi:hypothetical protein